MQGPGFHSGPYPAGKICGKTSSTNSSLWKQQIQNGFMLYIVTTYIYIYTLCNMYIHTYRYLHALSILVLGFSLSIWRKEILAEQNAGAVLFLLVPNLAILWPFPSQPYSARMEDVNIAVMTQRWTRTRTTWRRWQRRQWWNMLRLPRDSKQNPGFADWFEIPKYINIPLESFAPWLFRNMPSLQEPQYRWKSIVILLNYPIVKALLNVLQGFQTPSHTVSREYAEVNRLRQKVAWAQSSQDVIQPLSFHGGLSSHPPSVVLRDLPRSSEIKDSKVCILLKDRHFKTCSLAT